MDQGGLPYGFFWRGSKHMTAPPQKLFVYKFKKLASSIFEKAPYDFCAIYGFRFIDENVPKKSSFLAF